MWSYDAEVRWTTQKQGELSAQRNPVVTVATPPEFGGVPDVWCPEQLLIGAVVSCLMTTALHFFERMAVTVESYSATGRENKRR